MFYLERLYALPGLAPCSYCEQPCDPDDLIWNETTVWGGACPDCIAEIEEETWGADA